MIAISLQGQQIPDWRARIKLSDSAHVDFLQYFQIWNTVTLQSPKTKSTPRLDTYIRRARFGLGGQLNSRALFYVGFTYDSIGKDSRSASAGAPNPNDNLAFSIRDAFFYLQIFAVHQSYGGILQAKSRQRIHLHLRLQHLAGKRTTQPPSAHTHGRKRDREREGHQFRRF